MENLITALPTVFIKNVAKWWENGLAYRIYDEKSYINKKKKDRLVRRKRLGLLEEKS